MAIELVERFARGGEVLTYAAQGLTAEQQTKRIGPGEWSIIELIVHVLDADLVFGERMKRLIAEDGPTLLAFDDEKWMDRLDYRSMPLDEAAALFDANRRWVARLLRKCDETDFARSGNHSEKGPQTLAHVLAYATNHLDHHLTFLHGKRANLGVSLYPRFTSDR